MVFVIVGVPLWPLAMFWDGVRLRGGENGTGRLPDLATMSARRGMLRVPAKGGKTDTTTCTAPFGDLGCAPLTELRPEGTQRPGARLLLKVGSPVILSAAAEFGRR